MYLTQYVSWSQSENKETIQRDPYWDCLLIVCVYVEATLLITLE